MRAMIRSVLLVFCILSAVWAYQVNYEARSIKREIKDLEFEIKTVLNRIDLLEAEWAFLNRPKRLAVLVDTNFDALQLVPITKNHFRDSETFNFNFIQNQEKKDGD